MLYKCWSSICKIVLSIYVLQDYESCSACEFDRNYFGVILSPYVKQFEDGIEPPSEDSYTHQNVETMLAVVSTKFSRLMIYGDFTPTDQYIFNHTYYYNSSLNLHSAELAAQANKKNTSRIITVILRVVEQESVNETLAEAYLTIEAAERANKIFPDTVEGIIITAYDNDSIAYQDVNIIFSVREKTSRLGINLGLLLNCNVFLKTCNGCVPEFARLLVKNSDFIYCAHPVKGNPVSGFLRDADQFVTYSQVVKSIKSTTDLFIFAMWSSSKLKTWDTVSNLQLFWETANTWCAERKIRIYLGEAFDNPGRRVFSTPEAAHMGWWKLTDNTQINNVTGYVEKVSAPCPNFQFDKKFFGVTFEPHVAPYHDNWGENLYWADYDFENIQTMLTVTSRRFSNLLVYGPFGENDRYEYNVTYYKSWKIVRTGEAAAHINLISAKKLLTLVYYVPSDTPNKVETEFMLACEAAEKANKIFPSTVVGVVIDASNLTKESLKSFHRRTSDVGVKFGGEIDFELLLSEKNDLNREYVTEAVKMSGLVAVFMNPLKELGPTESFLNLSVYISSVRETVTEINPGASTIILTEWSSSKQDNWSTVDNQRIYWETASKWAAKEKMQIFLMEAIDNPWHRIVKDSAHRGWWKLNYLKNINSAEGYVEKISELPGYCVFKLQSNGTTLDDNTTAAWTPAYTVGIIAVFGCVIISIVVACIAMRFGNTIAIVGVGAQDISKFIQGSLHRSFEETGDETANNLPYDISLEVAKNHLKFGKGEFGLVHKAQMELKGELVDVAVKVPKDNCPSETLKALLSEIKIMSYLGNHANIVVLMGAYTAELANSVVYVVTEFCSLGSLERYLRNTKLFSPCGERKHDADNGMEMRVKPYEISFSSMLRWAHEIACGMEYLASKHVVHADLATRNVLLNSSKTAKISDFGLSRRMYNYSNYVKRNQEPLPWRWMAFESLERMEFSTKSDVWSYGITLWEIFSKGSIPYSGMSWTHGFNKELLDGLRPDCPLFASPKIFELMQNCWKLEAADRPCFSEISCLTESLFQKDFDIENAEESVYIPIREIE